VLVLAPTRELGNQIAAEAAKYHVAGIDTVCVYGGASKGAQMASLRRGADCVVATPGRCIDLIDEGAFDLSQIRYLVLDEADRM
jgi:superfamily II DNA/RNA helicase